MKTEEMAGVCFAGNRKKENEEMKKEEN